jgi:hypothetical protein
MIEAAQIPGWDTAKRLLIEIHSSFQRVCRADEENDRLIAREEAYATEKKNRVKERVVALIGALQQCCNFRPYCHDGLMAA